jgi:hypothetical protein
METGLMRIALLLGAILLAAGQFAHADGRCDLDTLVGYQIVTAKPIIGYIQDGLRQKGYEGCELDRVLLFTDNTGVRCKDVVRQHLDDLPTGFLFARNNFSDMKLCVDGELFAVSPTN